MKMKKPQVHLRFFVGAEGFEPPTLPTYQSGCPEPAINFLIRILLFQDFTSLSLTKASCLEVNASL